MRESHIFKTQGEGPGANSNHLLAVFWQLGRLLIHRAYIFPSDFMPAPLPGEGFISEGVCLRAPGARSVRYRQS